VVGFVAWTSITPGIFQWLAHTLTETKASTRPLHHIFFERSLCTTLSQSLRNSDREKQKPIYRLTHGGFIITYQRHLR
jgi:hypothetical protein